MTSPSEPSSRDDVPPGPSDELRQAFVGSGKRVGRRFERVARPVVDEPAPPDGRERGGTAPTAPPAPTPAAAETGGQLQAGVTRQALLPPAARPDDAAARARQPATPPVPAAAEVTAATATGTAAATPPRDSTSATVVGAAEPASVPASPIVLPRPSNGRDTPGTARRRAALLVITVSFVAFFLGLLTGQGLGHGEHAAGPSATVAGQVTPSRPAASPVPSAPAAAPVTAPVACLETARAGDMLISLLTNRETGAHLDKAMRAYATASRNCRRAGER